MSSSGNFIGMKGICLDRLPTRRNPNQKSRREIRISKLEIRNKIKVENSKGIGLDAGGLKFVRIRIFDLFRDSNFGFKESCAICAGYAAASRRVKEFVGRGALLCDNISSSCQTYIPSPTNS
jgi:hypothetical protein